MKMRLQMGRKGSCVGGVCLTHALLCDTEMQFLILKPRRPKRRNPMPRWIVAAERASQVHL